MTASKTLQLSEALHKVELRVFNTIEKCATWYQLKLASKYDDPLDLAPHQSKVKTVALKGNSLNHVFSLFRDKKLSK